MSIEENNTSMILKVKIFIKEIPKTKPFYFFLGILVTLMWFNKDNLLIVFTFKKICFDSKGDLNDSYGLLLTACGIVLTLILETGHKKAKKILLILFILCFSYLCVTYFNSDYSPRCQPSLNKDSVRPIPAEPAKNKKNKEPNPVAPPVFTTTPPVKQPSTNPPPKVNSIEGFIIVGYLDDALNNFKTASLQSGRNILSLEDLKESNELTILEKRIIYYDSDLKIPTKYHMEKNNSATIISPPIKDGNLVVVKIKTLILDYEK